MLEKSSAQGRQCWSKLAEADEKLAVASEGDGLVGQPLPVDRTSPVLGHPRQWIFRGGGTDRLFRAVLTRGAGLLVVPRARHC